MLVLDLRWVIFVLLLVCLTASLGITWLTRRAHGNLQFDTRRTPAAVDPAILDRIPVGWLELDGPDRYAYANPYAQRLLALEAASGRLPDADWHPLLAQDQRAARLGAQTGVRYRSVALSPDRFASWWVMADGDRDLVLLSDTTTQQQAEKTARWLISDLSHELRTPIATLLTHIEILLLPDIEEETKGRSLQVITQESNRMARLVHDMLELGRLETMAELERRAVDMLDVANEAVAQTLAHASAKEVRLSLIADTPLDLVLGNRDQLKQVLLNLLDNGIKYCLPGDKLEVALKQESGGVRVVVSDSGPGIPAQHLPHLTRRFYRTGCPEAAGSGLGLSLVDEIVRRHDGHLAIESRAEGENTGTQVSFLLPILPIGEEMA